MKKSIPCLIFFISFSSFIVAQDPNLGFENWEGGIPSGWFTSNLLNFYVPISQTTDARSGTYAVHGTVVAAPNNAGYSPLLSAGLNAKGFPINFRPGALHGWYKFSSDSGDAFSVSVVIIKNRKAIGSGGIYSTVQNSVYTEFIANISYNSTEVPDTAQIIILIANSPKVHVGSTFILDDLSFGGVTGISESGNKPYRFILNQNFPNPFNPVTTIHFQIPERSFVSLQIFNLLGQKIVTLINEELAEGNHRVNLSSLDGSGFNLPSGTYFYRLQAGDYAATKKMLVIK